jgi:hypothetical protein
VALPVTAVAPVTAEATRVPVVALETVAVLVAADATLVEDGEALATGADVPAIGAGATVVAVGTRGAGGGVTVAAAPPQAARNPVSTPMLSMANRQFMVLPFLGDAPPPVSLHSVPPLMPVPSDTLSYQPRGRPRTMLWTALVGISPPMACDQPNFSFVVDMSMI